MKGYMYTARQLQEVIELIIGAQDLIVVNEYDEEIYELLEEALEILDPEV